MLYMLFILDCVVSELENWLLWLCRLCCLLPCCIIATICFYQLLGCLEGF